MRCYHIISFGALPIYFVIRSTEQSELLLVFLDVEYDMVNRGKKKPRTLYPHRRPTVSEFHALFIFFFPDHIGASFQMQILNKEADCPCGNTMCTCPEKYCGDRVCAGNSIKTLVFNDCFTTSV